MVADSRAQAPGILRKRGIRKKQFRNEGRPVREVDLADITNWLTDPEPVYRRRDDAGGWSEWEPVPDDVTLDWRIRGKARRLGSGGHIL